jgi:hypothetical protein
MKRYLKKYTSLTHYIEFLRKQPEHMQHVYAVVFAGSITMLIACVILYVDYGFWHEKYIRDRDDTNNLTVATPTEPESPSTMFSRFFGEAKDRFQSIDTSGSDFLKGKETYTNDSQ